ncbi:hypothetical protein BDZ45DRAFT_804570 [Acephala macrosclerotiorum]|nr:hypothetical protein BDZ45DRAFT_804570 [Acephala macrosclerotiorum]
MGLFFEFRNGSTSSWKLPRRDSLVRESLESPFRSSSVVFGEIMELHKVSVADRAELGRKMELITTFGPSSGSLFVDAPRPELYRGCSQFQRERFELAYEYLKEAHTQDWINVDIRKAYAHYLIALRLSEKMQFSKLLGKG